VWIVLTALGHSYTFVVFAVVITQFGTIGMLPTAFALGEGGEQNAPPLGRAAIGGLLVATAAILCVIATVFGLLHARRDRAHGEPAAAPGLAT
jgi:Cu/Ag efflux pump CusA